MIGVIVVSGEGGHAAKMTFRSMVYVALKQEPTGIAVSSFLAIMKYLRDPPWHDHMLVSKVLDSAKQEGRHIQW